MHLSDKMIYLEPVLVHPVRRQNFRDTVAQKCNPYLIRGHSTNSTKLLFEFLGYITDSKSRDHTPLVFLSLLPKVTRRRHLKGVCGIVSKICDVFSVHKESLSRSVPKTLYIYHFEGEKNRNVVTTFYCSSQ